jgi:hypothetical protein
MRLQDLTGQKFNRLEVVKRAISNTKSGHPRWVCFCECGRATEVDGSSLKSGNIKSCGCLQKEINVARSTKHGGSYTSEYTSWALMKARCYSKTCPSYSDYGGRGIKVCERWLKFENFLEDIGNKPSSEYSIDRIDVNGDYTPENCRWATVKEQSLNKRSSRLLTIDGVTKNLYTWCREYGISPATFYSRLKRGYSDEILALTTPIKGKSFSYNKCKETIS